MSLLCAVKVDGIPGYELLESVDFNGSQYILTDIDLRSPNYTVSVSYLDEGTYNRFGSVFRILSYDGALLAIVQTPGRDNGGNITHYISSWTGNIPAEDKSGGPASGATLKNGEAILYFANGNSIKHTMYSRASAYPLYFVLGNSYNANADGSVASWVSGKGWIGKIYSCQIKDASGTTTLHNLVAVKQRSTNYIGMYDTVNNRFYRRMDL